MVITINIPTRAQILSGGFEVAVAPSGHKWLKGQLGDYADKRGVYIHHANGRILYVGKTTTGDYGTFGERLRREFQEAASSSSSLHRLLVSQSTPIRSYLLDLTDLDMMVDQGPMMLPPERKALIMEQVLIGIYEPEGNRT
jgi:hypothetical protein